MTDMATCRYVRRNGKLCVDDAVDPEGEILLCAKHLTRAIRLYRRTVDAMKDQ